MARHAMLIATTQHSDAVFSRLTAPEADVRSFAVALRSPDVGGFDSVVELVNRPSDVVREEIEGFFQGRTEDDLLVLYLSGHGVVNSRGQLHLVTATTKRDRLAATAIPADFVRDQMDECHSRQQVLILDCCYSGAFDGAKGGVGASVGTEAAFEGNGLGRIVLTATDATQFAFEADDPSVDPSSVFTHFLVEGLQGGPADLGSDGRITIDELYDYACQQLVKARSKQTPGKWSYWQRGEVIVARKPRPTARPDLLSPKLLAALESSEQWECEGAVRELIRLLGDPRPGLVLAVRERLGKLVNHDSKVVSGLAREALDASVGSPPAARSSTAGAPTATLDSSSGPSRNADSLAASEARPAQVAGAAASTPPAQPAPAGATNAVSPPKPGVPKSYASLKPRSVRPSSPEPGPAQVAASAVPIPPPNLTPAAGSPEGSPVAHEVATPDASLEPSGASPPSPEPGPAQVAASSIPTPPLELFTTGVQLPSSPPVEVPPSSIKGTSAGPSPTWWSRRPPRLLLAGAAGLLVAALATFMVTRKGSLNVEVRPTGNWSLGEITVTVDGEKRCSRSPCVVDGLAAGAHQVSVAAAGYRRQSLPVGVSRGAVNPVPMTLELDGPTGIAVADLGSGVQLFVDGQSRGYVPQELNRLAPGEHQVRIEGERYHPFTTRVMVEAGKMVSMAPKLKVKKGRVTIQPGQDAEEAKIELVCGDQRRPVPKQAFDIPPEPPCRVVAAKDGFEPFDRGIQFKDGEAEQLIRVDLVPSEQPRPPGNPQASSGVTADGRAPRLPERRMPER